MDDHQAVIVGTARTPVGSFGGGLSAIPATKLGSIVIKEALNRAGIAPSEVQEVIMGMVLQGGVGQAPARQAAIGSGIPNSASALTVNKVCSSGLKAVMLAEQLIRLGECNVIIAGGMENMSLAPYFMPAARNGFRLGHGQIYDMMVHDGLWDVYGNVHMGSCAELCAREKNITREDQDAYAAESYRRAQRAIADGKFKREIIAVEIPQKKGDPIIVDTDEEPGKAKIDRFPTLKPAFDKNGTVTAANASSINDGASATVITSREYAKKKGLKILAGILGQATFSQAPEWFTTAPTGAVETLLKKVNWKKEDVDLFELNEAFSVVSIANNRLLGLDPAKVNIWGGAVAIGHPIGASGNRILVTLIHALKDTGGKRGIAGLCNGGGEATALAIEIE
jgi:acetyl-CoA C-acetyltransferase